MNSNEYNPAGYPRKRWRTVSTYGRAYTRRLMASDARNKAARKMREVLYIERVTERDTEDLKEKAQDFTEKAFYEQMAEFMNWGAFRYWEKLANSCKAELARRQA